MEQRSTNRSKRPLLPKHVCSIRARLEMQSSAKDLAMFNLAIGSKLRASDLMHLRITDVCSDQNVRDRGVIVQKKTGRPVQFEVTRETRLALEAWIAASGNRDGGYMPRKSIKRPATFALCNCFWDIPRSKARLDGAQGRDRTTDTAIFNRMLYQLSYLGAGTPSGVQVRAPRYRGRVRPCPAAVSSLFRPYSSASLSRSRGRSGSSSASCTGIA